MPGMPGKLVSTIREMRQRLVALRQEVAELEAELEQAAEMLHRDQPSVELQQGMPLLSTTRDRVRPIRNTSAVGAALKILKQAQRPMHVDELIEHAWNMYSLPVVKTTLVSGLARYVKAKDTFTRTAPNVYGLVEFEEEQRAAG